VIDFFTEMAGFGGSNELSPCPVETRLSAECTWPMSAGKSTEETVLLLT
jgi:hypothetical protein